MSNWQGFVVLAAEFLLLYSHFRPQSDDYDNIVKAVFEIALPYSIMVTLLYWFVWYEDGWIVPGDWRTYVGPFGLHAVPIIVMLIDWALNNIIFDYKRGIFRLLYVCTGYIGLNYFSYDIIGDYPYKMINY